MNVNYLQLIAVPKNVLAAVAAHHRKLCNCVTEIFRRKTHLTVWYITQKIVFAYTRDTDLDNRERKIFGGRLRSRCQICWFRSTICQDRARCARSIRPSVRPHGVHRVFVSFGDPFPIVHERDPSSEREASPKSRAEVLLSARFHFRAIFGEAAFAGY